MRSEDDFTAETPTGTHHHHYNVMVEPTSLLITDDFPNAMGTTTYVVQVHAASPGDSERPFQIIYLSHLDAIRSLVEALLELEDINEVR